MADSIPTESKVDSTNTTPNTIPSQGEPAGVQGTAAQTEKETYSPAEVKALIKKLEEYDKDNKKYRDKLKDQDAKAAKEAEEALKSRGEFEKLYNDLKITHDPLKTRIEQLTGVIKGHLDAELTKLSAVDKADFEKLFGELDPETQLAKFNIWATSLKAKSANTASIAGLPASQVMNPEENMAQFKAVMDRAKKLGDLKMLKILRDNQAELISGRMAYPSA